MSTKATATIVSSISALSITAKLVILAVVIILGANTYAIQSYRAAKAKKSEFGSLDYIHSFIGGVFSGIIFFLLCLVFIDNEIVAWLGAGVGAFMGFSGLTRMGDILMNIVETKLKRS